MKQRTLLMLTVLAGAYAAPARAQDAPVAPTPPPVAPETAAPAAPATPAPTTTPAPSTSASVSTPASTPRAKPKKKTEPKKPAKPALGLAIATPDIGAPPGRFRPSYGSPPRSPADWKFDFHGYLNVPLRVGIGERKNPLDTQYSTVFHGPPISADEMERFEHTGVIPQPWVQLGFSYGNSDVMATIIIGAKSASNATSYLDPPAQVGINDAFVTFTPHFKNFDLKFDVGAFANRYGSLGEYDTGRYDTPVVARVAGVGYTAHAAIPISQDLTFLAEDGTTGQFDRAPLGVAPAGWNGFTDSTVGTSFAHHDHLGLALRDVGQLGLHWVNAFTRDDRTPPGQADGGITVLGADVRSAFGALGRVGIGFSQTIADHSVGVSGVVRVLNTFGGPGLIKEYFGPDSKRGTGTLTSVGAQYDLSIGELIRKPSPFSGYGPDILVSAFGMLVSVQSEDKTTFVRDPSGILLLNAPGGQPLYDGVLKLKYGAEATYSALSWFAFGARYDRVLANTDDDAQTLAAITPRLIFRTDYNSQDQVTLAYSHWWYGSGVVMRPNYRDLPDPSVEPDSDTFSLSATMWW